MSKEEILRRLDAIISLPEGSRPVNIYQLCKLSGISVKSKRIYLIIRERSMGKVIQSRLSRAFELLENGQVEFKRTSFKISEQKKPPIEYVKRLQITPSGPKLVTVAKNPMMFPDFKG